MKKILFAALFFCLFSISSFAQHTLPPLPYAYNALEPFIDAETMTIHHTKHHQAYVTNLNNALPAADKKLSVEDILKNISKYPDAVRNNAGGHYNHSLFWTLLTPKKNTAPSSSLQKAINKTFTNLDTMKSMMNKAGAGKFGSGWVWLVITTDNTLKIISTSNQDNPLMNIAEAKGFPLIAIDLWEHAYYLKYQNKRGDYLAAIWNVINWDEISRRYEEAVH